MTLII